MYILRPHAAGILYPPPFYTPPTPRRAFSGVGGWGCINFGPVLTHSHSLSLSLGPEDGREHRSLFFFFFVRRLVAEFGVESRQPNRDDLDFSF